ncbi:MAG: type II toxin-antitoxin system RelE/ParE family toxin [Candidatus Cyclonatronum sp.]|uniref:type II toxin-antitoxin system RelE/ParE family toxin n=1 Tax=Cyclonatronum sp. TaxID=3024185 RepID=UPI0025BC05E5|nr:type II toxin-antitoxin system RelE/ParE family toxin [Cyclonatronum sp.]MCC5934897.1 type II toxin-antitoxin system RelE/ParE family toxin [Balneolales bacterium]MCH8488097.1 type II toxin-antitoxin system RelE/ParE family toxin [Cyclonatronum sp.]
MSFEVYSIPVFEKQTKRLGRKYPSLKKDLAILIDQLSQNPVIGTPLGKGFYKVRLSISSKGKGKSAGARVITYVKITETAVYLSYIYDKSQKSTIAESELEELLRQFQDN